MAPMTGSQSSSEESMPANVWIQKLKGLVRETMWEWCLPVRMKH